ncbi:hypothetical protein [Pendulispora albinea]|uniref:Uncharacterized protein n=1 Tax=Pendulispora albinea TaxID=2741071 RepID=A0ABZ2M5Q7_9BACT
MSSPPDESNDELEPTPEEVDGIRLALEEIDRGEALPLENVMAELREELQALEEVRVRRRTG